MLGCIAWARFISRTATRQDWYGYWILDMVHQHTTRTGTPFERVPGVLSRVRWWKFKQSALRACEAWQTTLSCNFERIFFYACVDANTCKPRIWYAAYGIYASEASYPWFTWGLVGYSTYLAHQSLANIRRLRASKRHALANNIPVSC